MTAVTIAEESPRQPAVIRLLELSDAYAASLYPAESNHLVDLSQLEQPTVSFFVARRDGEVVGCCGLVEAGDGTAEIKRMFVDPEARGLKLGKLLLSVLEAKAAKLGPRQSVLRRHLSAGSDRSLQGIRLRGVCALRQLST